jgi:hypothetical protein
MSGKSPGKVINAIPRTLLFHFFPGKKFAILKTEMCCSHGNGDA